LQKKRGITPVIATVILIAVAVALSIAIAFWAGALTGDFAKYGKLDLSITTHYAAGVPGGWNVTLAGSNQGSQDLSITQVELDGIPYTSYSGSALNETLPVLVPTGSGFGLLLFIPSTSFSSGQDLQVTVVTAQGDDYTLALTLP
jgi:flagellin-like protein